MKKTRTTNPEPGEGAARFVIEGRVQGVGFRWWVAQHARELNLVGSVRNSHDGTVEVEVGGDPSGIDSIGRLLEQGPSGAVVARVTRYSHLIPPEADGFVIER